MSTDLERTRTVSVSVSPEEAAAVASAAGHANMSKSAWAMSRIVDSLSTGVKRSAVLAEARKLAADGSPRGSRNARVSAVMPVHDHEALKAGADKLQIAVHAYVQAVVISAARDELASVPGARRRVVEHAKAASKAGDAMEVEVPAEFADIDIAALSEFLHRLVGATCRQILDGAGRKTAEGAPKLAAKVRQGETVTLRLAVPEFEVLAAAHVLGIPSADYATALATRAARAMLETA